MQTTPLFFFAVMQVLQTNPVRLKAGNRCKATLRKGCCKRKLMHFKDASVKLFCIDPPYEMTKHKWDKKWSQADWQVILQHAWRVLAPGGRLVMFGKGDFFCETQQYIKKLTPFKTSYSKITWVHPNRTDSRYAMHNYCTLDEDIGVFMRSEGATQYPLPNHTTEKSPYYHDIIKSEKAMKPLSLMKRLICNYTQKGDTVADICFYRACITGQAAIQTGRNFTGIELDASNFKEGMQALIGTETGH